MLWLIQYKQRICLQRYNKKAVQKIEPAVLKSNTATLFLIKMNKRSIITLVAEVKKAINKGDLNSIEIEEVHNLLIKILRLLKGGRNV